jgi:hypothetical protein
MFKVQWLTATTVTVVGIYIQTTGCYHANSGALLNDFCTVEPAIATILLIGCKQHCMSILVVMKIICAGPAFAKIIRFLRKIMLMA